MKRIFIITLLLSAAVSFSCTLLNNESGEGIYVLDWEREAVYRMGYDFDFYEDVVCLAGTAPTSMIIYNDNIYIANSGFGGDASIQSFSLKGKGSQTRILKEGSSPAFMAADEDYIYLSLWGADELIVINPESLSIEKEITGIKSPQGVFMDENIIYVGSTSASPDAKVYKIFKNTWIVDSITAGSSPSWVAKNGSSIYALCAGNFDEEKGKIVRIEGDAAEEVVSFDSYPYRLYSNGTYLYALDYSGYVFKINAMTRSVSDSLQIESPSALAFTNDKIIAGTNGAGIYLINLTTFTKVDSVQSDFTVNAADFAEW